MRIILLLLTALLSAPASSWAAEGSWQGEIAKATLVTEKTGIAPGEKFQAGIWLEPKEGWHTYWENPGDAGIPTTFVWTLPEGFSASGIDWPMPQRLTEGPLVTYSYTGNMLLPVTITPPAHLDATAYPLKLTASWLICKDICIPETAEMEITLPVKQGAEPSEHAGMFDEHRKAQPQAIKELGNYRIDGKQLVFSFPLSALQVKDIQSAMFFPRQENVILYASEQKLAVEHDSLRLTIDRTSEAPEGNITGLLSLVTGNGTKNFDITLAPSASAAVPIVTAAPTPAPASPPFLPAILLAAILGGLILNLMPCVLPVLSLKALAIVRKGGHSHAAVVRQGFAYTLGIEVSFAIVAGILIILQQTGESVGWGYQMQSPAFVGFLIYLLFLVGLNMSGVFHLPVLLGNVGGSHINESSAKASFFTGVLATAVATPCTAPFMAGAVGVALTLPAWQSLLIFEALGLGLALPFLIISLFPALRRFLPKPGIWMETLKEVLAFPMYASVIWLMWVLALQTGAGGMAVALTGMLALAAIIWMKKLFPAGSHTYRVTALTCFALVLLLSLPALGRMEIGNPMPGGHAEEQMEKMGVDTVEYSKAKLDELRKAGKPVFIDATAAWCITCQLNARVAIRTDRTMAAFKEHGVTLMVADWTRRNDEITDFLSGFGYKGVPLYVFYPAGGGNPVVLPQLLTEDTVITTITAKGD